MGGKKNPTYFTVYHPYITPLTDISVTRHVSSIDIVPIVVNYPSVEEPHQ